MTEREKTTEDKQIPTEEIEVSKRNFFPEFTAVTVDNFKNIENVKLLPSSTSNQLKKLETDLGESDINVKDMEDALSIALLDRTRPMINFDDMFVTKLNSTLSNHPVIDGVDLGRVDRTITKRVKSTKNALIKLSQKSGLGTPNSFFLYHSGFWVTIKPLTDETIINLELELVNELNTIGKKTNTLIFSNYSIVFTEVIMKYFEEAIVSSSLKIDEDESYLDFISINDVNLIALQMGASLYPNGIQKVILCSQTSVLDENNKPKCNYKAKMKLHVKDLLWVDESKLNLKQRALLTKKVKNSVTTSDVITYQAFFNEDVDSTIAIPDVIEGGDDTIISLRTPSITTYLEHGNYFINNLAIVSNNLVTNSDQVKNKQEAENILINALYLQLYNHFVLDIKVDDAIINDVGEILEGLELISANVSNKDLVITRIKEYIEQTSMINIGVPNFVCPSCSTEISSDTIIPIAVLEYFFTLLHSKYTIILGKIKKS